MSPRKLAGARVSLWRDSPGHGAGPIFWPPPLA